MLNVSALCRGAPLRAAQGMLRAPGPRLVVRQLVSPARGASGKLIVNNLKVSRISEALRSSGLRLLSSTPKDGKTSKLVGYWLLGCSGMVFTAVVLGMGAGYLILLYSIYYIINIVLSSTNGGK